MAFLEDARKVFAELTISVVATAISGSPLIGAAAGKLLSQQLGSKITDPLDREVADENIRAASRNVMRGFRELVESQSGSDEINVEAVILHLNKVLSADSSLQAIVDADLDEKTALRKIYDSHGTEIGWSDAEKHLYRKALFSVGGQFRSIASQTRDFDQLVQKKVLERLSGLEEQLTSFQKDIAQQIDRLAENALENVVSDEAIRASYLRCVRSDLDWMNLFGIADATTQAVRRHNLSAAYISLSAQSGDDGSLRASTIFTSELSENRCLLLVGPAGSGKTTLLRWAAINVGREVSRALPNVFSKMFDTTISFMASLQEFQEKRKSRDAAMKIDKTDRGANSISIESLLRNFRLQKDTTANNELYLVRSSSDGKKLELFSPTPFVVPLRRCVDEESGRLIFPTPKELCGLTSALSADTNVEWVKRQMVNGALIMFDGVDEVPPDQRDKMRHEILKWVDHYPNSYFVVTTRPGAIEAGWLSKAGFKTFFMEPLTPEDQGILIDGWHRAVTLNAIENELPDDFDTYAGALKKRLAEDHMLRSLARWPLICALICAYFLVRRKRLAVGELELFDHLIDILAHDRESARERETVPIGADPSYRQLTKQHKRKILQILAHRMAFDLSDTHNLGEISDEVALVCIKEAIMSLFDAKEAVNPVDILKGMKERSGVFIPARSNSAEFIHNDFKDYLAAERLDDTRGEARLLNEGALLEASRRRIIQFACWKNQGIAEQCIKKLDSLRPASRRKRNDRERYDTIDLIISEIARDGVAVDASLREIAKAARKRLFPPRNFEMAAVLAVQGDSVIGRLRYSADWKNKRAAAAARTLRLVGTEAATAALAGYLVNETQEVGVELAMVVDPLRVPWVKSQVTTNRPLFGDDLGDEINARIISLGTVVHWQTAMLDVRHTGVSDVSPLAGLTALQTLNLWDTSVSDVSPLSGLTALQTLILMGTGVSDLSPLSGLTALQNLDLMGTSVSDVSPLSGLTALQTLILMGTGVSDLSPLMGLTALQTVILPGGDEVDWQDYRKRF